MGHLTVGLGTIPTQIMWTSLMSDWFLHLPPRLPNLTPPTSVSDFLLGFLTCDGQTRVTANGRCLWQTSFRRWPVHQAMAWKKMRRGMPSSDLGKRHRIYKSYGQTQWLDFSSFELIDEGICCSTTTHKFEKLELKKKSLGKNFFFSKLWPLWISSHWLLFCSSQEQDVSKSPGISRGTRRHSGRMHTVRCSGHLSCHTCPPPRMPPLPHMPPWHAWPPPSRQNSWHTLVKTSFRNYCCVR